MEDLVVGYMSLQAVSEASNKIGSAPSNITILHASFQVVNLFIKDEVVRQIVVFSSLGPSVGR